MAGLLVYARAMAECQDGMANQLGEVLADAMLRMDAAARAAAAGARGLADRLGGSDSGGRLAELTAPAIVG